MGGWGALLYTRLCRAGARFRGGRTRSLSPSVATATLRRGGGRGDALPPGSASDADWEDGTEWTPGRPHMRGVAPDPRASTQYSTTWPGTTTWATGGT